MNRVIRFFKQAIICAFFAVFATQAAPSVGRLSIADMQKDFMVDGDSFIPIPWGKEVPISWMILSGSWMLRQGDTPTSYFTFKVLNQTATDRILYIQQIDPKTCATIGVGVGNLADSKVIYATLRNSQNREVYRLNLRNFSVSSFVKKVPTSFEGSVVMLSIAPINSYKFTHFSMARVNQSQLNIPACRAKLR